MLRRFTAHRENPANCTPIHAWTGVGGHTAVLNGTDTFRRQTTHERLVR